LLTAVHAPVSYWPAPQVAQVLQTRSFVPPHAPVSYWPAPQLLHAEQTVSVVAPHEAVW
jgi:hypothetical protein